ncbi:dr1-associated corepressor-like [Glycine soja]|uniref:dr1-associated corepressor-like n=1 Tax=Glycine soja TaxID=3848 RepID=UPI00103F660B|nr:dr1-associated corepressor-like [Glycine soja]XP_028192969.1 dr1-associated corepressor-like [Glycine soja]
MQKLEEVGSSVKARIKKIMQADEDVGKIALAVPVLVSKALELFLQDLCDRTYEITLQRGAKTMNSLHFLLLTIWNSDK